MGDLISREKAYEVLTEYYHHKSDLQHLDLIRALDRVPDAERKTCKYWDDESNYCTLNRVPPEVSDCTIVFCRYCSHFKSDFWCDWWEGTVGFNDYCSKGERKVIND